MNAAALLSHTTHRSPVPRIYFSFPDKMLLFHPHKLQNNYFSMSYLIEQLQGKRCLEVISKNQTHRQKRLNSVTSNSALTMYLAILPSSVC